MTATHPPLSELYELEELEAAVRADLAEVGFQVASPRSPKGGVNVYSSPTRGGVRVGWRVDDRLALDGARNPVHRATRDRMLVALARVLRTLGYAVAPSGGVGPLLVTGRQTPRRRLGGSPADGQHRTHIAGHAARGGGR